MKNNLNDISTKDWENLCRCCGVCCLYKIQLDNDKNSPIFLTTVACNFLNL